MLLKELVEDFALGMEMADREGPQAMNSRSGQLFQKGIGPHTETMTTSLVFSQLCKMFPNKYENKVHFNIPYATNKRLKCDLCIGNVDEWTWNVEIKMLRFMGDNGKTNDNILMHILSPYPHDRSALTDCGKLLSSGLCGKKAILIFAYDYKDISSLPAIEAYEVLVRNQYIVGERLQKTFNNLIHPVHGQGVVYAWEIVGMKKVDV